MAACWALIGFAAQCFVSLLSGDALEDGMKTALVHYLAWGCAGFVLGTVFEQAIDNSFQNYTRSKEATSRKPEQTRGSPSR